VYYSLCQLTLLHPSFWGGVFCHWISSVEGRYVPILLSSMSAQSGSCPRVVFCFVFILSIYLLVVMSIIVFFAWFLLSFLESFSAVGLQCVVLYIFARFRTLHLLDVMYQSRKNVLAIRSPLGRSRIGVGHSRTCDRRHPGTFVINSYLHQVSCEFFVFVFAVGCH